MDSMQISMDITPDTPQQQDICILKCPFCSNNFIIPHVYRTHLLAHIHYHSRGNVFSCGLCPKKHKVITSIITHIEKGHSKRIRQQATSPFTKQVERANLAEKERQILQLSNSDDPDFLLKLPY